MKQAIDHARDGFKSFESASAILSGGPGSYYLEKIEGYVEALFSKYAPFKVGDRVTLTKEPPTDNDWRSCRHFLQPGSVATVIDIDYRHGQFLADLMFDEETWIDGAGVLQPVQSKHTFCLPESLISKLSAV